MKNNENNEMQMGKTKVNPKTKNDEKQPTRRGSKGQKNILSHSMSDQRRRKKLKKYPELCALVVELFVVDRE